MRNRRGIAYGCYSHAGICNRTNSGFTSSTGPFYSNLALLHSRFVGLLRRLISRLLSSERRALPRPAKASSSSRRLRNQITSEVGNRDHRVIKRCRDMRDSYRYVFLLFLPKDFLLSACFCHILFSIYRLSWICSSVIKLRRKSANSMRKCAPISCLVPSSWQSWRGAAPCACERWYAYVVRGPADLAYAVSRDSNQCPSNA